MIVTALDADAAGQVHVRVLDPDLAAPNDVELTLFAADCTIHPRNSRGGHGPDTTFFASPAGRVCDALLLAGLRVTPAHGFFAAPSERVHAARELTDLTPPTVATAFSLTTTKETRI